MRDTRFRDVRLRDSISNQLARLFRQQTRVFNKALKTARLSSVHANILMVLWLEGPMTIGQLQASLAIGSSSVSGAIDRMEKADLLRRVPVPGDRRAYRLEPVQWTKTRRQELIDTLLATEEEIYSALSETERRQLLDLLVKVSRDLESSGAT